MHVMIIKRARKKIVKSLVNVGTVIIDFKLLFPKTRPSTNEQLPSEEIRAIDVQHAQTRPKFKRFLEKLKKWKIEIKIISTEATKDQIIQALENNGLFIKNASIFGKEDLVPDDVHFEKRTFKELSCSSKTVIFALGSPDLASHVKKYRSATIIVFIDHLMTIEQDKDHEKIITCDDWDQIEILEIFT